ncbi:MAG: hypothetical protein KatS3mg090_1002 [Patescibacteria group bacterium]|nr:MAG: hypothetical protein KatS3mg090_0118 [Patescibacteria group bacterium]GIW63176.1 MAG: hypothetical protein KatS3mg090_1002 [Patescibacteria group bacterium]
MISAKLANFFKRKKAFLIFIGVIFFTLVLFSRKNDYQSNNILKETEYQKISITLSSTPSSIVKNKVNPTPFQEFYKVVEVIDGDTIVLENGEKVRYIGIDTPELNTERGDPECFALEAKKANERLVLGKKVKLEKDVSERDKYGRLLRYVYVEDIFVNEYLVREGYAKAVSFPPDVKYQERFLQAERQAREKNKGLWDPQACKEKKVLGSRNCKYDCNGPDRDCKDFKTQAKAQEFFICCGFTKYYDPMNLDAVGIGDGIAC